MKNELLDLPQRPNKPRTNGITILIDNGVPLSLFKDTISHSTDFIDFVKFGWGTSIVTRCLEEKIACLREQEIQYFFGGTLFEKFYSQGKIETYYEYCKHHHCQYIEISNGTISLTNRDKANFIREFSREFRVLSEVGNKDVQKSRRQNPHEWIDAIAEDLDAGAEKVITEARESGTSGICNEEGEIRDEIIREIISSGIPIEKLIFEAPKKAIQTHFIKLIGPNVNLANIPFADAIALETLRLGLRSDTFYI